MKCSYPKSAHILCKQALIQARIYCACYVHASTHSSLRILCKLCTCIHPLKPAHTLQAVYMHPPTQSQRILCKLYTCIHPLKASAYSASCVNASTHSTLRILCKPCTFRPRMQACMQVCMRALHAKFACTGGDMHAHAEHACRGCCM